jgi:hypothetical protein
LDYIAGQHWMLVNFYRAAVGISLTVSVITLTALFFNLPVIAAILMLRKRVSPTFVRLVLVGGFAIAATCTLWRVFEEKAGLPPVTYLFGPPSRLFYVAIVAGVGWLLSLVLTPRRKSA